jgi:hypothetical protein
VVAVYAGGRLVEDDAVHGDRSGATELIREVLKKNKRLMFNRGLAELYKTVTVTRLLTLVLALTLTLTPALTPTLTLGLVDELVVFELLIKLTLCGT